MPGFSTFRALHLPASARASSTENSANSFLCLPLGNRYVAQCLSLPAFFSFARSAPQAHCLFFNRLLLMAQRTLSQNRHFSTSVIRFPATSGPGEKRRVGPQPGFPPGHGFPDHPQLPSPGRCDKPRFLRHSFSSLTVMVPLVFTGYRVSKDYFGGMRKFSGKVEMKISQGLPSPAPYRPVTGVSEGHEVSLSHSA